MIGDLRQGMGYGDNISGSRMWLCGQYVKYMYI